SRLPGEAEGPPQDVAAPVDRRIGEAGGLPLHLLRLHHVHRDVEGAQMPERLAEHLDAALERVERGTLVRLVVEAHAVEEVAHAELLRRAPGLPPPMLLHTLRTELPSGHGAGGVCWLTLRPSVPAR